MQLIGKHFLFGTLAFLRFTLYFPLLFQALMSEYF